MRIGYLDCFAGVAGDMWVGALLDLGVRLDDLLPAVRSLGLEGVSVEASKVVRAGLGGTRFVVRVPGRASPSRHLADLLAVLERADLPERVGARCAAVFRALAEVEAAVHDRPVEEVHFHEVGAEDTIVDVVCACLGVHLAGFERLYASTVETGSGTVSCAHGVLPVPAPGTLGNLIGIPLRSGGAPGERTTPTGAALLKVLVAEFEPRLTWVPEGVGYGAGTRDDPGFPNLLRIAAGSIDDTPAGALTELSCNLDTATGETLAFLLDGALSRGSADAWVLPAHMKKGRPGHVLCALVDQAHREGVVSFLLEESSSLGVRMHGVERAVLERWSEDVDTELGRVRFKVARLPSGELLRRPEDDEVRRLAEQDAVSRREVLRRLFEK